MKTQLSLTQLAQELERRRDAKKDFIAPTTELAMQDDARLYFTAPAEIGAQSTALEATAIAHDQIGEAMGIPGKYYDRMRAEAPGLLARNVNHWLQEKPRTRMVRTLDGQVRAFLSDRYNRIENEEIASTVLPILLEQEGVSIESAAITEERMYIKAVFSRIEGEVRPGDFVQAGVAISNSEVGKGAVKIEPLIYRLVCKNGMIVADQKFRANHVGARAAMGEGVYEMLSSEAIAADDKAILLKTRDIVRASFDMVRFEATITKMRESTTEKLEGNPAEAIKVLAKATSLNEFESGGVLRHLIEGGDLSRWGVVNAVTRTAQDVESYDRATELETLGGQILAMTPREFEPIRIAA